MDWQAYEENIINKVHAGEKLSEDELEYFATQLHCVDEIEDDDGRWTRSMTSIIELPADDGVNEYWAVDWEHGLTEYQEDAFFDQPRRVTSVEKTIVVREWGNV